MEKAVMGNSKLWQYALINKDGKIGKIYGVGSRYSSGPKSGSYVISLPDPALDCAPLKLSRQYTGDMGAAIKFFALRKYSAAWNLAQKSANKDQAIAFKADLDKILSDEVKELTDVVGKSDLSAGEAWNAIARCKAIEISVAGLAELKKLVAKLEMRPDVVKERLADQGLKQAATAYAKANSAKNKNEDKVRADYGAQLKRVMQNYPGTQAAIKAKTLMEQAGL